MTDEFDLDGMLDDVLNDTMSNPVEYDLDSMMDDLLLEPVSHVQIASKYKELLILPLEQQKEWERVISTDEVIMELRKYHPLSNAYAGSRGSVRARTIEELFTSFVSGVVDGERETSDIVVQMSKDPKMMKLFREELGRRLSAYISPTNTDVLAGDFSAMKALFNLSSSFVC